jgi:NAD(P)-dependent dehydrogenase (short-subunit alcohol dehydrogenase family)
VIIASRKQDACDARASAIKDEFAVDAVGIACNVGDWVQCDHLVEASYDHFGKVDILVNDAGLSPLYPSVTRSTKRSSTRSSG